MKQHIRQHVKRHLFLLTLMLLMLSMALPASAAAKIRISKKKATLYVGETLQLKVKGAKKATWSSSAKKVAKVSKKGKVTALKKGSAKITAKVNGKKYVCRITVKEKPAPATQPSQPSTAPVAPSSPSTPSTPVTPSQPQETEKPQPQTEPQTDPATEPVTEPDPVDPMPTQRTVASQADLNEALQDEQLETITLASDDPEQISVPEGDYSGVELIVNMPQGDVTNQGQFRLIRIRAIAWDTFEEQATGNTIIYEAGASGRIVVEEGAKATIKVTAPENGSSGSGSAGSTVPQLVIENRGEQRDNCNLVLETKADLMVNGMEGAWPVNIEAGEAAEGSTITASTEVRLTAQSRVIMAMEEGSQGSKVYIDDVQNTPVVCGVGSVEVVNTVTGRSSVVQAESILSFFDVTGEGVTGYIERMDRDSEDYNGLYDTLTVYTDLIENYPEIELSLPLPDRVTIKQLETDRTFESGTEYAYRLVLSTGEAGTDTYEEKTWYVCFEYRNAQGKGTESFLHEIESVISDDVDAFEVRELSYSTDLIFYYDRVNCQQKPESVDLSFTDGTAVQMTVNPDTGRSSFQRGIWTVETTVSWIDSFLLRNLMVNGVSQGSSYTRNETTGEIYSNIFTDAWEEYPEITIQVPKDITYKVVWEPYEDAFRKYQGTLTINNGKRKVVYGLWLRYDGTGGNTVEKLISIKGVTGDQIDYFEENGTQSLFLYCDVEKGEHPETFTVTLQDGSSEEVTAEPNEYDNWYFTVHSGIWSKQYLLSWLDCFGIKSLTCEEFHGQRQIYDSYVLDTGVWDHYPDVTVTLNAPTIDVDVTWFEEEPDPYDPEAHWGELTLSNGRGGVRKIGLDLQYESGEGGLETVGITDISGENLAGWEKKEGVGIGLYYEKDYCGKPLDLEVQLTNGKSTQTSVKLLAPEYGDYEYAQLSVRSGIWTLYYNAFYADCFALSSGDISVEGDTYYPQYNGTDRTFSVGTTLWDTYPEVEVNVHGVVPTVKWFGEETGEQITSGALNGQLTLSRGEHSVQYGLCLSYAGSGDDSLENRLLVQSVSASGIDPTPGWADSIYSRMVLYSLNGTIPETMSLTKADGSTCTVKRLHEGDDVRDGYYTEVTGGIWKRRLDLVFKLASMDVWQVKSVTGTGVIGYRMVPSNNYLNYCDLGIYCENDVLPADLQITYADGITFIEDPDMNPSRGGKLRLGIFETEINIFCALQTTPDSSTESSSQGSSLLGEQESTPKDSTPPADRELDEDITDLLLTEEDQEQVQEAPDLYADAEPEYDSVAPAGDDESMPVFIDEAADDEIIAEESDAMWDGQKEGSW